MQLIHTHQLRPKKHTHTQFIFPYAQPRTFFFQSTSTSMLSDLVPAAAPWMHLHSIYEGVGEDDLFLLVVVTILLLLLYWRLYLSSSSWRAIWKVPSQWNRTANMTFSIIRKESNDQPSLMEDFFFFFKKNISFASFILLEWENIAAYFSFPFGGMVGN